MNIDYEIINSMIGEPWVYKKNDCWAVVQKASKLIFATLIEDIKIPDKSSLRNTIRLFNKHIAPPKWVQTETLTPGCAVMFKSRHGEPVHIGIHIEKGNILHCRGDNNNPGQTAYDQIGVVKMFFGSAEYYEYRGG